MLETQRLSILQKRRNEYLASAKRDVEARRAMHNSELQSYDREIKPLKRKQFFSNLKQGFQRLGNAANHMGPG